MTWLKRTYFCAAVIGGFCLISSLGCFIMASAGVQISSVKPGDVTALGCLEAGIALTCYLWWRSTRQGRVSGASFLVAAAYAGSAGLALDTCAGYLLWGLGAPFHVKAMDIGTMAPNYWVGPVMLVYAVGCRMWLDYEHRRASVRPGP